MARRPTKLQFYDHPVTCPYCRAGITVYSLMEYIIAARRTCPHCKHEMLIHEGRATKIPAENAKKPPKVTRSHVSKAKD